MFCETCGTVLDVHGQCVNCEKNKESKTEIQVDLSIDILG